MERNKKFEHFKPFLGFEDKIGQELRLMSFLENKLSEQFQLYGYDEVNVPILEKGIFYSKKYVGSSPWPEWNEKCMFKLDVVNYNKDYKKIVKTEKGVLIPEGTLSVCRLLSNLIAKKKVDIKGILPLKLYYSVKCFRNEPVTDLSLRKKREFKQVGLEFLGSTNEMADVEVIYLISKGLESVGIPKDKINVRLGNIRLFNQLCNDYNIKNDDKIVLKEKFDKLAEYKAIEKDKEITRLEKDINSYLKNIRLSSSDLALWRKIYSEKRGIEETLDIIRKDFKNLNVASTLENISEILKFLKVPFKIDTCVVRSHEYYTDTVFEVDVKGKNKTYLEIAGGGRYNKLITNLLEDTTISIPATGFAYGLERVLNIIRDEDIGKSSSIVKYFLDKKNVDYVIFPRDMKNAWEKAEELRNSWNRVDMYFQDNNRKNAKSYAKRKNALFLEI